MCLLSQALQLRNHLFRDWGPWRELTKAVAALTHWMRLSGNLEQRSLLPLRNAKNSSSSKTSDKAVFLRSAASIFQSAESEPQGSKVQQLR
jgi:hypothetical protein